MNEHEVVLTVLSSSLLSSAITGFFALRIKGRDYVDDYFRKVLDRRIESYERVERLIYLFKFACPGPDARMFHAIFNTNSEDPGSIYELFLQIDLGAFWLSDDIFQETREITNLLILKESDTSWQNFGMTHYRKFATIRTNLERLYSRDLKTLHKVPKFLRAKRHVDSLHEIQIARSSMFDERTDS